MIIGAGFRRLIKVNSNRARWWKRPWIAPLALVTVLFLVVTLPPYLSLDPTRARLVPLPDQPWFYPVMVAHIFLGSVVLLAACLQVWPWLRRHHPRLHRWSGRVYVAALVPAAVCVLLIAPLGREGPNQQVANLLLGVLWLTTTLAGWRAARRRAFGTHREWMIRSVALSFSIVVNRFWVVVCLMVFAPGVMSGELVDPAARSQAVGVAAWLSWVLNLLIAEWWLRRRRPRGTDRAPRTAGPEVRRAESAPPVEPPYSVVP